MKVLFVCNQNMHRSPTAERLFSNRFETRSRGLFGGVIVESSDMNWADAIAVMEPAQRIEIVKRFPKECLKKRLLCLNVPDVFSKDSPELIKILERKNEEFLEPFVN